MYKVEPLLFSVIPACPESLLMPGQKLREHLHQDKVSVSFPDQFFHVFFTVFIDFSVYFFLVFVIIRQVSSLDVIFIYGWITFVDISASKLMVILTKV